ncbi:hypothetical protein ACWDBO_50015 [Streptomyces mirabilis]|uniref:hypothetical protein n=1 Tax=Streptomyces mirabilis TaxID=68239 RepID=UPI00332AEF43
MVPVHDLVRPEETLDFLRAQYERTALTPVPLHQLLVAGADSPSERPGCAGAGRAQGWNAASSPVNPRCAYRDSIDNAADWTNFVERTWVDYISSRRSGS